MSSEKQWDSEKGGLSSRTYLNTTTAKSPEKTGQEQAPGWCFSLYQMVRREEIRKEMARIADRMSFSPSQDFGFLKGQWVVLFRLLNPRTSLIQCQLVAEKIVTKSSPSIRLEEAGNKAREDMSDNEYLTFCGVKPLPKSWKPRYGGCVEAGDLVYSHSLENWLPAEYEDWGRPAYGVWVACRDEIEVAL